MVDVEVIASQDVMGYAGSVHARVTGDVVVAEPVLTRYKLSGYFLLGLPGLVNAQRGSSLHAPTP